ncbi:aldehyde dehydrogenase family protein, partial [Cooperia oncophora]
MTAVLRSAEEEASPLTRNLGSILIKVMKIAVIGQSAFGVDVYKALRKNGHEVVVVFTIPDKNGREDLLVQKPARWRKKVADGKFQVPGAWATMNGERVTMFGSKMWRSKVPPPDSREVEVAEIPGGKVTVDTIKVGSKTMPAHKYGLEEEQGEKLVYTEEEKKIVEIVKKIWESILKQPVSEETDFFESGGSSADVTRLCEEVKFHTKAELENTASFAAKLRILFSYIVMNVKRLYDTINPNDESVICKIPKADVNDLNKAVAAATAFENGEWRKMSARDRGKRLYKLADLMEEHKEELATLESLDAGAVYTLALKTHVGMSIDVWRYFAGWCDKIEGHTIPISNARPNFNLTLTKREPVGVVGLITPWNYPLMMLSWKMAACLAAGNTVVHKPAQ